MHYMHDPLISRYSVCVFVCVTEREECVCVRHMRAWEGVACMCPEHNSTELSLEKYHRNVSNINSRQLTPSADPRKSWHSLTGRQSGSC